MTVDDQWNRLSALFDSAHDLGPEQQAAFLADLQATDPELIAPLRRMLRQGSGAAPILDRPEQVVASLVRHSPSEGIPARVGSYRIIRQIGEGGMGRVYLVEREGIGGHAALKVLRDAWASPERRQRFAREQETLARLSHPGIAQLFEVGALPDGTPWFAMELVDGLPLVEYVATRQATVRDRLDLVRAMCRAVQHAHAHAVIHRDIKPSNVMVTATGTIKLLDFGIAKQVDSGEVVGDRTQTGYRMLTPDYAAPEQFTGGPIGVQTDVHAIGVLLFELLAQRLPWGPMPTDPGVSLESHRQGSLDLAPLARRGQVAPGRANWPELDVLVRTAMHQDPARRYPSVEALGRDIDHYLANEPLDARPDTLGYRAGRMVRRHWRAVASVVIVLATTIALSVGYTRGLTRARDAARLEADRTARLQQFMMALFQGGDATTGPGDTLRVRSLIDRGAREAEALSADPRLQAELRETLGELRRQLGDLSGSDTLLRQALTTRQRILGPMDPDIARSLLALARLRLDEARLPEADSLIAAGLRVARATLPLDHPVVLAGLAARGRAAQDAGDWDRARQDQFLVYQREALADSTSEASAAALVQLAGTAFYAGELDRSDSLNHRALEIYRARRGDRHPLVADILINLGAAEFERGNYADAERLDREALDLVRGWHGATHSSTASALTLLGRALLYQSRDAAADTVLREARRIQVAVHGPHHPTVASANNELGTIALRAERYADAEEYYRENITIYQALYGPRHWLIGIAESNLGSVAMGRQDYHAAERAYRRALDQFIAGQGPEHLNSAIAHVKLGRALLRQGRAQDAAIESRRGYDLLAAKSDAPEGFINAAKTDLADAYERLGDRAEALRFAP